VVALVFLVACIIAGGAVYVVRSNLLKAKHLVPGVVGETVASASRALRADHFKVRVDAAVTSIKVGAGDVVRQVPGKGVTLVEGSVVRIVPSSGKPMERIPQLSSSIDCSIARQLLAEKHLNVRCPALSAYSKTVPKGDVINWSYQGKLDPTSAPYGATILVAISEGNPPVQIPSFANQSYTQAAATLSADGLTVKEVFAYSTTVPSGRVSATTPPAGATIPVGLQITVTVSNGPQYAAVPTVIGKTVAKATAAIQAAGLTVGAVYGPGTGVVFTTDPLAGQKERIGTPVVLYTEKSPGTGNGPKPSSGTGSSSPGSGGTSGTGGSSPPSG
jgi:serine/threonine-protein kinase